MLNKSIYGLNDAPRRWWSALTQELQKLGCKHSKLDVALMYYPESPSKSLSMDMPTEHAFDDALLSTS